MKVNAIASTSHALHAESNPPTDPAGSSSKRQRLESGTPLSSRGAPPDTGPVRRRTQIFEDNSQRTELVRVDTSKAGLARDLAGVKVYVSPVTGREAASDGHMHPTNYSQRGLEPRELLKRMDEIGIRNTTLMPIPTSIIAPVKDAARRDLQAHHCGEPYYIPAEHANIKPHEMTPEIRRTITSGHELFVDSGVDASAAHRLRTSGLTEAEMSRFDPMITGLHLGSPISGDALLRKLYENKGAFTGIGEITIHKELVEDMFAGKAQANLKDNVESFKDLMGVAGVIGMPVVLHCDVDSLDNQALRHEPGNRPANLANLKKLFADPKVADTDIVWAHAGGLGRFVMEPDGHSNELQGMLDKHPRLHLDISWSKVAEQLTASREAMDRWHAFMEKNNTRILFGSDTLSPANNQKWDETRQLYEPLLERLSPTARANILNGNYDRVFVEARPKVREFEEKVLTPEFYTTKLMSTEGPRSVADWLKHHAAQARLNPATASPTSLNPATAA